MIVGPVQTLQFLFSHLAKFRGMFFALLFVGGLDGIASFSVPILLAEFTKMPVSPNLLSRTVPFVVICLGLSLFFQWCLRAWGESLTGWLGNDLRLKLFSQLESLSLETLSSHHSGYLAALVNQVTTAIGGFASNIVWLVGHLATTLSLFVFFTARESIGLALFNLVVLTVFVSVSVYLSRKIVPLADERNRTFAIVMERFIDLLSNISTVKKLGVRDWALETLRGVSALNDRAIFRFQRFHANRWSVLHVIFYTSVLSTITLLLYRVQRAEISPSILILFIAGFGRVQSQAERLSELIKGLLETNAYVERLSRVVGDPRVRGTRDAPPMRTIEHRNVYYRFPERTASISIPSFTLEAGGRILIAGASGQGKSTFLGILAHHLVPREGECFWNGLPYSEFNDSLSRCFALVSQEAELFDLSLRENLALAADVSDGDIEMVLNELGMGDLLKGLPEGLSTRVGEKGLRLSTGQKQRLNLARALLLKRPILLLDEPTAHLDAASEDAVIRCLKKLPSETTLVIVSHHNSLRSLCTKHYLFENGEMSEVSS